MWDWGVWFVIAVAAFLGALVATVASYWLEDLLTRVRARRRFHAAVDASTFGEPTRDQVETATDPVPPAFTCQACGARSWHPEDGRHGWCGACHAYTGRPSGLDFPTDKKRPA